MSKSEAAFFGAIFAGALVLLADPALKLRSIDTAGMTPRTVITLLDMMVKTSGLFSNTLVEIAEDDLSCPVKTILGECADADAWNIIRLPQSKESQATISVHKNAENLHTAGGEIVQRKKEAV